jgi:hypothetical protein
MDPPTRAGPQVFVVVPQMPDQVVDAIAGDGPMVRDAGDPAQCIVGVVTRCVHLADDGMFGALHRRQRRHGGAHTVAPILATDGLECARRIGESQFGCLAE